MSDLSELIEVAPPKKDEENLSTLIEPVLIVIIGGMVLFLALAIFLPMWDMASLVRPR